MAVAVVARGVGLAGPSSIVVGVLVNSRNAVRRGGFEPTGGGINRRGEGEHGDGQRKQRGDPSGPDPFEEHAPDYHLWVDDQQSGLSQSPRHGFQRAPGP